VAVIRESPNEVNSVCEVDQFSIRNAFRNVVENALAACEDPVAIELRLENTQHNGAPALRIAIRDNGPGFPQETAARAFDAFHTTKTHGTGLGLAIVKRAVEEHGGYVAIGMWPGLERSETPAAAGGRRTDVGKGTGREPVQPPTSDLRPPTSGPCHSTGAEIILILPRTQA
jgi:signal transduction histidine kinase